MIGLGMSVHLIIVVLKFVFKLLMLAYLVIPVFWPRVSYLIFA